MVSDFTKENIGNFHTLFLNVLIGFTQLNEK